MGTSFCYGMGKMGEWMHADFQYEHFDDPSFFREKSYSATEEWKALGHAARHDPCGLAVPGFMSALRMPADASFSDKAEAWGRGAVDIALIACTVFKAGQFAANAAKLSRGVGLGGKALEIGEIANVAPKGGLRYQGPQWRFPKNPLDLLKELARDPKGRIYTSDNLRIRPEQHLLKPGEIFNARHHGQHYHVETRRNSNMSWRRNDNIEILKPPGYTPGSSTGFLPDEFFPGL